MELCQQRQQRVACRCMQALQQQPAGAEDLVAYSDQLGPHLLLGGSLQHHLLQQGCGKSLLRCTHAWHQHRATSQG